MAHPAVWKYTLFTHENELSMPYGARVIHVADQQGQPTLWAIVDRDAPLERRRYSCIGTGVGLGGADPEKYVGTARCGPLVWHVFRTA